MSPRQQKMFDSLAPEQQQEWKSEQAKSMKGSQLTDLLKGIDLGSFGKPLILGAIHWFDTNLLPKVKASNAMLGMLLAGLLDSLEASLSK